MIDYLLCYKEAFMLGVSFGSIATYYVIRKFNEDSNN
jgi:hypothetical protein